MRIGKVTGTENETETKHMKKKKKDMGLVMEKRREIEG